MHHSVVGNRDKRSKKRDNQNIIFYYYCCFSNQRQCDIVWCGVADDDIDDEDDVLIDIFIFLSFL